MRVVGALLAYVAMLALLLTLSRAGLVAGVVVVLLWLLLSRERVEGGLLLAAAGVPAALVAGWAFTRPALVEEGAAKADRVSDGRVFGVLTLVGAALVVALVLVGVRLGLDDGAQAAARAARSWSPPASERPPASSLSRSRSGTRSPGSTRRSPVRRAPRS